LIFKPFSIHISCSPLLDIWEYLCACDRVCPLCVENIYGR
jgi:hypothetical protein